MIDTDRITGAAREAAGRVQAAVGDRVGSDRDGIEGRVREAEGRAENLYGRAKDGVRDAVAAAGDYAEEAVAEGRHQLRAGHDRAAEWPHASLIVAGLVGFGLGLLVSRI